MRRLDNIWLVARAGLTGLLCGVLISSSLACPVAAYATFLANGELASSTESILNTDEDNASNNAAREYLDNSSDAVNSKPDGSTASEAGSGALASSADDGQNASGQQVEDSAGSSSRRAESAESSALSRDNADGAVPHDVAQDGSASVSCPQLTYAAHVSEIGWQPEVSSGEWAGTTGRSLSMEALRLELDGAKGSNLEVCVHVSDYGWTDPVGLGEVAGTTGKSKALEALSIRLTGELATCYDIWYRVHVANVGWLGWASNGQNAGSVGYGNAVEAIEIILQKQGDPAPGDTAMPFKDRSDEPPSVVYRTHVSNIGWQGAVSDGAAAGTTGRSLPVEALETSLLWYGHGGTVEIRAHIQDFGWQDWGDGSGGTTGRAKGVEAVQLRLTGEAAESYDIWYRVHAANIGWMGWTSNGSAAGSTAMGCSIEAIQIVLVEKGGAAPGPTEGFYKGGSETLRAVSYDVVSAKMSSSGASSTCIGSELSTNPLQSVSFAVDNQIHSGSIAYRVRRQFADWDADWSRDGEQVSSTCDGSQIEGVQLVLEGELADSFDIWYRAFTQRFGWTGWGCNGASVGTEGYAEGIVALEVRLVPTGAAAPGDEADAYIIGITNESEIVYQAHSSDIGWQPLVADGDTAGTTGQSKALEALRVALIGPMEGSVRISAHVSDIGWQEYVSDGALVGTTGKALSIEALKIELSGALADSYDVAYRVHSAEYGWLGWARNGDPAGTTGLSRPVEAVEIRLVPKGSELPDASVPAYVPAATASYQSYVSSAWQAEVSNGSLSGTTGCALPITCLRMDYQSEIPGEIAYSVHVQDIGWMSDVYSGSDAGSADKTKQIEAIKIHLTGQAADFYDVWYRAYVEDYGWLGWAKNGDQAGTGTIGYRMEAFEVRITAKGSAAPGSTANAYRDEPYRMNAVLLPVPCLLQYPELPTGCESVALTNVLNYYGYGLAKTTIADQYLPRSSSNFVTAFWGNPHSSSGNCTSAPGIVNAANSFLLSRGDARRAVDISGTSLDGMYEQLQEGNPVIVWSTISQANIGAIYARQWYNGKEYFTVTNSHTVVLRGFDRAQNLAYLADSISGYVTMDASRFYLLYSMRGAQAVVIQ